MKNISLAINLDLLKKNELKCNFFTNSRFEMDSQVYAISKDIMEGPGEGLFDHIAECLAVFAKGKFCFFLESNSVVTWNTFEFSHQKAHTKLVLEVLENGMFKVSPI